jgi:hypothetical protein
MSILQLSVFLENKPGALGSFAKVLRQHKVDMRSLSIAESRDFGIIRVIADDPRAAAAVLHEEGYIAQLTPVVAVAVPDEPGALTRILETLSDSGINVDYTYAFPARASRSACIVLRTGDLDRTAGALEAAGIQTLSEEDLKVC